MRSFRSRLAVVGGALLLSAPAGVAGSASEMHRAESRPSRARVAGDILFARPVRAVRLVMGLIVLPIAWPTAELLGDADWAVDVCVRDPLSDLVDRPLGDL